MFVQAVGEVKVPKEFKPREYIEQVITEVPDDSVYYARRILDKDLVEVTEADYLAQQAEITAAEEAAKAEAEKTDAPKKTKTNTAA